MSLTRREGLKWVLETLADPFGDYVIRDSICLICACYSKEQGIQTVIEKRPFFAEMRSRCGDLVGRIFWERESGCSCLAEMILDNNGSCCFEVQSSSLTLIERWHAFAWQWFDPTF